MHNGKTYHEVVISEEMVGRKLGEYVPYVCLPWIGLDWVGLDWIHGDGGDVNGRGS